MIMKTHFRKHRRAAHPRRSTSALLALVLSIFCFDSYSPSNHRVNAAAVVATPSKRAASVRTTAFRQAFFRGGVARSFGQAVLYPVDAMRTLAQTRDAKTLSDVGAKALVRGCFTTSSFALGMGALQFSIFSSLKEIVGTPIAATLGGTASCLVSVPQEGIKQNLVTGVYPSFRSAVRSIATTDGASGFYRAWRPTMLRNVPFVIFTFTAQDTIKNFVLQRQQNNKEVPEELSFQDNLLVGMTSALLAGIATNPIDVIKTRMMTQASSTAVPYKSALDCFATVLQKEGITTFFSGFQQRSVYICGLWGITFAINGKLNSTASKSQNKVPTKK